MVTAHHPSSSSKHPRSSSHTTITTTTPSSSLSSSRLLILLLAIFLLWATTTFIHTPLSILLLHLQHRQPFSSSSSIDHLPPPPPIRKARVLFYWKPHKTGSTSVRSWLLSVASILNVTLYKTPYYPYSDVRSHVAHLRHLATQKRKKSPPENRRKQQEEEERRMPHCAILAGHVRVPPVFSSSDSPSLTTAAAASSKEKGKIKSRPDERVLGAVLTSTRRSFDTLASKFFHRAGVNMTSPTQFKNTITSSSSSSSSAPSSLLQHWRFHWHAVSPCEPLAYYDGHYDNNCNLTFSAVHIRARAIAQRVDCVIDTNNPLPDLHALCAVMHIPRRECPRFGHRRVKHYSKYYDGLGKVKEVAFPVRWHVYVMDVLRFYLRRKRCRFVLPQHERSIASSVAVLAEADAEVPATTRASGLRTINEQEDVWLQHHQTMMASSIKRKDHQPPPPQQQQQNYVRAFFAALRMKQPVSSTVDAMDARQQQQQQLRTLRQQMKMMPKWPFPNCHLVEDAMDGYAVDDLHDVDSDSDVEAVDNVDEQQRQ